MHMVFEVQDLANASPATVSRYVLLAFLSRIILHLLQLWYGLYRFQRYSMVSICQNMEYEIY